MYVGFDLMLSDNEELLNDKVYHEIGSKIYQRIKQSTQSNLEEIINKEIIDGDLLQNLWFPNEIFGKENFVFISHSHDDEDIAIKLAGYLYDKFEIHSFIDSCVWRYMDDLNKILNGCSINDEGICCGCNCKSFSYNLSYVHMMLASALMHMIDKCECMFFLNTPASINVNNKTESPWIYYELKMARVIRKKSNVQRFVMEHAQNYIHKIEFTPDLNNLLKIDENILRSWEKDYSIYKGNPYEILYEMFGGV